MSGARSSAGDPARTLALLWRDPAAIPRHGPGRGLDLDTVVGAAVRLADSEGLDALTMRRLATTLEVAPMTLYTYVPSKAELLDLMLDTAYATMDRTDTAGQPWRKRVRAVAANNRTLYLAHPWASAVSTQRPPLGPGQLAKYDHELAAFEGLGLSDVDMDSCLTHLLTFVQAWASATIAAHDTERDSGISDEQWWATAGALLGQYVDEATYPLASRVGSAAGAAHHSAHDPDEAYEFGIERILDGLAALVEKAAR